ncbi:MAG: hypothetical protein AB2A00_28435 [Myxococcota bacterium]
MIHDDVNAAPRRTPPPTSLFADARTALVDVVDATFRAELGRTPDAAEREQWRVFLLQRSHRAPTTFWLRAVLTAALRATPEYQARLGGNGAVVTSDSVAPAQAAPAGESLGAVVHADSADEVRRYLEEARRSRGAIRTAPAWADLGVVNPAPVVTPRRPANTRVKAHRDVPHRAAGMHLLSHGRASHDENEAAFPLVQRFYRRQ